MLRWYAKNHMQRIATVALIVVVCSVISYFYLISYNNSGEVYQNEVYCKAGFNKDYDLKEVDEELKSKKISEINPTNEKSREMASKRAFRLLIILTIVVVFCLALIMLMEMWHFKHTKKQNGEGD